MVMSCEGEIHVSESSYSNECIQTFTACTGMAVAHSIALLFISFQSMLIRCPIISSNTEQCLCIKYPKSVIRTTEKTY